MKLTAKVPQAYLDFGPIHQRHCQLFHRHSALGYRTPAEYAAACTHDHYVMAREIN